MRAAHKRRSIEKAANVEVHPSPPIGSWLPPPPSPHTHVTPLPSLAAPRCDVPAAIALCCPAWRPQQARLPCNVTCQPALFAAPLSLPPPRPRSSPASWSPSSSLAALPPQRELRSVAATAHTCPTRLHYTPAPPHPPVGPRPHPAPPAVPLLHDAPGAVLWRCQPKVPQLEGPRAGAVDVVWLYVQVGDAHVVKVLQCAGHLHTARHGATTQGAMQA